MRRGRLFNGLGLAISTLLFSACSEAPKTTGTDQVHDSNVTMTALKDNHFEQMSWEDVDTLIVDQLVPNPSTEPGCAVGIVRDGEILYLQGYGNAQLGGGGSPAQPWGVGTMGAVGSISKTLTAAAMLSLVDDGHVGLGHDVLDYLATNNGDLGSRTLESLISHSSGIGGPTQGDAFSPNWEPSSAAFACLTNPGGQAVGFCEWTATNLALPEIAFYSFDSTEPVTLFAGGPGLAPGVYSNVGMSVAGAVIDRVAQDETDSDGYEAYVWDELGQWSDNLLEGGHLNSLALTHSWRDTDIPNRAIGYGTPPVFPEFEAWQGTGGLEGWEGPSGGWAMTIGDLARFMIALDESSFFDDSNYRDLMRAPHTDLAGFGAHYGMGMFLGSGTVMNADSMHGGDIAGHHASWAWWDDYQGHEIGIGLMCNRDDMDSGTLANLMTWQSGEQTEETLVWLAANQNPDPPSKIVYAQVPEEEVEGQDFAIESGSAWLVGGQHLVLPIGLTDLDLFLSVEGFERGPTMTFGQGVVGASGEPLVPNPVELRSQSYQNPSFMTHPVDMTFDHAMGSVLIRDLVIEGVLGQKGASLEEVSLSGRLDTRDAIAFGFDPNEGSLCRDAFLAGGDCVPCADGEPACLDFRYANLGGIPVPEPGFGNALLAGVALLFGGGRRIGGKGGRAGRSR